jgi:hypothetical protein
MSSDKQATEEKKQKVLEKLGGVFTLEQLEQLAELMVQTHDLAVLRETRQTVIVVFNEKGFPREFNGSNNLIPVKPVIYKAE